jgi:hypothetical protein
VNRSGVDYYTGKDVVSAGERHQLGAGRRELFDGVSRGVILCHPVPILQKSWALNLSAPSRARWDIVEAIIRAGYLILSTPHEAPTVLGMSWANDASTTKVMAAVTYLTGPAGARPDKVAYLADGMGGATAFNTVRRTGTAGVAGIVGLVPAVGLGAIRTAGAWVTEIDAAYGGAWAANAATHDPVAFAAASADVPFRAFTHSDDVLAPPSQVQLLAAVLSDATVTDTGTGGSGVDGIDPVDVVSALDSLDWS